MEKLKMHSPDVTQDNIAKLAELFPNCVTETRDEHGAVKRAIDFDQLRQELSTSVVDGPQERYHLNWPGKREALLAANAPIAKTLRPCREESVNFDTTQNLFIEGDNLDALKLLQETYLNKVKLIYIDPPYNTGNDFIYDDDFAEDGATYLERSNQVDTSGNRLVANSDSNGRFHSDWLSMMYPRIRLARNLLRNDGVLFVSVDDHEQSNATKICDEIFGRENFVASFVWQKRTTRENRKVFSFNHDFILCFAKHKQDFELNRNLLPLTDEVKQRYTNPDNDPRGVWQSVSINAQAGPGRRKEQFYTVTTPGGRVVDPPAGRCWIFIKSRMDELISQNRIYFGSDGNNVPRQKVFLTDSNDGLTPHTLWTADEVGTTDSAKRDLTDLFDDVTVFDTPKPVGLLSRIVQIAMNPGDIGLDFFAGSAPLAEAIIRHSLYEGCPFHYIMVQLPEPVNELLPQWKQIKDLGLNTISDISKERIRRAGKKLKAEGAIMSPHLDIGFRVLKVDTSNMKDVYYAPDRVKQGGLFDQIDNIRQDRTPEDLLFQVLLDWGVDLSLPIVQETVDGKSVFFVDGNALAACFDNDINEELVKTMAARKPLRAVFRDAGFSNDSVKINVEQLFKLVSPSTEVKTV